MDGNFQCKKKTTVQYHMDGQRKSDIFGENAQQGNDGKIINEDEVGDDKDELR